MHTHASKVIVKIFQLGSNSREGNGTLPQYSCLENPTDRGAWWAAVYGDAQSRTRLKRLSSSSRLQQYVIQELPDVQAGFRKGKGTRDQVASIYWIMEKARDSIKPSTSASLSTLKPLTVWITTNLKILKEMGIIPDHLTCLLKNLYAESCEMPGWMNHKLESKLLGEISITSDMQMTPPLWQKVKRN